MNTKLILVEGLPGFGKTTTANLLYEIMSEKRMDVELFLEGNLDHPADYDAVSCLSKEEFEDLLRNSGVFKEILNDRVIKKGIDYLVPYGKIKQEYDTSFPDHLLNTIFKYDIYELPFERNVELITEKWMDFVEMAMNENKTYIFECCFIQNPVTIGMIKYGKSKEEVMSYVDRLSTIIEKLNPVLIYIEQENLESSFKKAVSERPEQWSSGFIDYYTNQGYGKINGYSGLDGTIQVLEARRDLEREIVDNLTMKKLKVNNSNYEAIKYKAKIMEKLNL